MTREGARAVGFLAAVAAVASVLVVFGPRLLGAAGGPETEILTTLKATEKDGLSLPVAGVAAPLKSERHVFDRIVVDVEHDGVHAKASSTLDFDGTLGEVKVSSLGLEVTPFVRQDGDWTMPKGPAPRLVGAIEALERRRRALEGGEEGVLRALSGEDGGDLPIDPRLSLLLTMTHRRYEVKAWYLRSDREEIIVSEEYRLTGDTKDRPIDEERTHRLVLEVRDGKFLFVDGLM